MISGTVGRNGGQWGGSTCVHGLLNEWKKDSPSQSGKRLQVPVSDPEEDSYKVPQRLSLPTFNKSMLLTHTHANIMEYNYMIQKKDAGFVKNIYNVV